MKTELHDHRIDKLLDYARDIGFTLAAGISPDEIKVENSLAANCRTPRCPYYGMSASCPPHVGGPSAIRKFITNSSHAVVLRLEVDCASLFGEERPQTFSLLHELTAAVEMEGSRLGFSFALGLAGGSCRRSFCDTEENCAKLEEGNCRYPTKARQSMSGYGINVGALMKSCGWSGALVPSNDQEHEPLTWIAGLVLLGSQP